MAGLKIPQLPPVVHILGCGPSAAGHLDDGDFAIALNAAIMWPRKWAIFAAFDLGVRNELWWDVEKIKARANLLVLGKDFVDVQGPGVLHFDYRPSLNIAPNRLVRDAITSKRPLEKHNPIRPGILRGNCGIAGCMLQYAVLGGAKDIYMLGIDMRGVSHAIGRPSSTDDDGKDWGVLNRLRRLALCIQRDYGVRIHWNRLDEVTAAAKPRTTAKSKPAPKPVAKTVVTTPLATNCVKQSRSRRPTRRTRRSMAAVPDVFQHLGKFGEPDHVYLVGAGATGAKAYGLIPAEAFTMATNGVIVAGNNPQYYPHPWTVWAAFDQAVAVMPYWKHAIPAETKIILGKVLASKAPRVDYQFGHHLGIRPGRSPITMGCLMNGATVIGAMAQLGWFVGATRFTLVAVDMQGDRHWDGSKAAKQGGVWPQRRNLQYLIDTLRKRGAVFNSLTPTALNVPVVKPGKE